VLEFPQPPARPAADPQRGDLPDHGGSAARALRPGSAEALEREGARSDSRISLLAGVSRKEIRRFGSAGRGDW